jgi:hypothetical protein
MSYLYPPHTLSVVDILVSLEFHLSMDLDQLEDGHDQTAQWLDFKFADNFDHTPI